MLPPLRFYSSVSNVDASPDALASGFELFACSTFLLERFAFDHACPYVPIGAFRVRSRLSLRSYWSVSRSITPAPTFLLERFTFDHACPYVPIGAFHVRSRLLFDAQRQTERLAECFVPIPPWVGIANSAFSKAMRLSHSVGSLRDCTFSGGDPDGERGDEGTRKAGEQNRRRGARALLRDHISFAMFSAGNTLGATRPQTCAKEPLALWTLVI